MSFIKKLFGNNKNKEIAKENGRDFDPAEILKNREYGAETAIAKGEITFEEIFDHSARDFYKNYLCFINERETLRHHRNRSEYLAEGFEVGLIYGIKNNCYRFLTSIEEQLESIEMASLKKMDINGAEMLIGMMMLEIGNMQTLSEEYEEDHTFNIDRYVDRCFEMVDDETAKKELKGYTLRYQPPIPTKEEVKNFVKLIDRLGNQVDNKIPHLNKNGFMIDENGDLLEEDMIAGWPEIDPELLERASNVCQERFAMQFKSGKISEEKLREGEVICAKDCYERLKTLSDSIKISSGLTKERLMFRRAALIEEIGISYSVVLQYCFDKDKSRYSADMFARECFPADTAQKETIQYYVELGDYLIEDPFWADTNLTPEGYIINQNGQMV